MCSWNNKAIFIVFYYDARFIGELDDDFFETGFIVINLFAIENLPNPGTKSGVSQHLKINWNNVLISPFPIFVYNG